MSASMLLRVLFPRRSQGLSASFIHLRKHFPSVSKGQAVHRDFRGEQDCLFSRFGQSDGSVSTINDCNIVRRESGPTQASGGKRRYHLGNGQTPDLGEEKALRSYLPKAQGRPFRSTA